MTDAQARNLGRLIQAARLRQGLSFRDLQKLTGGLPLSSLKALEDGRWSDPAPANVMRVAEALQIDPARIDRVSRDHLADALPGVRTYFRSKTKASPESYCQMLWMGWRENVQAATFSSMLSLSLSWSLTRSPSLKRAPSRTSVISSWPLKRRHRCWAASSSL